MADETIFIYKLYIYTRDNYDNYDEDNKDYLDLANSVFESNTKEKLKKDVRLYLENNREEEDWLEDKMFEKTIKYIENEIDNDEEGYGPELNSFYVGSLVIKKIKLNKTDKEKTFDKIQKLISNTDLSLSFWYELKELVDGVFD